MTPAEMLWRLVETQRRNSTLNGPVLADAAHAVSRLARRRRGALVAHDSTGERIIGAALVLRPGSCKAADLTERFHEDSLVVVSGMIAAPHALTQTINRLRSLGAAEVHVALLGGWPGQILGASTVTCIGELTRATAAA